MRFLLVATLLLAIVQVARAEVLGGGLANSDCRMVFRGVTATDAQSGVVCTDGDPTCDADATSDGTCRFAVRLCTGMGTDTCDTTPLSAASVAGLDLTSPALPAPDGTCGRQADLAVSVGASSGGTVVARDGDALRDVDYLDLCCVSGIPSPFGAARCATAIDLRISGCPTKKIKPAARRAFRRARALVEAFGEDPTRPKPLRQALNKLAFVHRTAKAIAKHDSCGDALGLVITFAENAVSRVAAATALGR